MSADEILLEAEMAMEKSVDYMIHEFASVRTGKASPALVENVDVHACSPGATFSTKSVASMKSACRWHLTTSIFA